MLHLDPHKTQWLERDHESVLNESVFPTEYYVMTGLSHLQNKSAQTACISSWTRGRHQSQGMMDTEPGR